MKHFLLEPWLKSSYTKVIQIKQAVANFIDPKSEPPACASVVLANAQYLRQKALDEIFSGLGLSASPTMKNSVLKPNIKI